jgi:DNA-binding MarR family transcriptional regulator
VSAPENALQGLDQAVSELLGADRRLRGRLKGDLTVTHIRALAWLSRNGGTGTPGEIARETDLNPASVTGMLDQLEAQGMIARERSRADRRVVEVMLTEHGRSTVARKREHWRACWDRALADVPAEDRRTATQVLRRITALYDEMGHEEPGPKAA